MISIETSKNGTFSLPNSEKDTTRLLPFGSMYGESEKEHKISRSKVQTVDVDIKSVGFGYIFIREYERTVGDNPSVSTGCPIGLDWKYSEIPTVSVDDFEECRPSRRYGPDLVIDRDSRLRLLRQWKVPQSLIASTVRKTNRLKNRRRTTVINQGNSPFLESTFDRMRMVAKTFLRRRTTSTTNELLKQHEKFVRRSSSQEMTVPEDASFDATQGNESGNKSQTHSSCSGNSAVIGPLGIVIQVDDFGGNSDDVSVSSQESDQVDDFAGNNGGVSVSSQESDQSSSEGSFSESTGSSFGDFSLKDDDQSPICDPEPCEEKCSEIDEPKLVKALGDEPSLRALACAGNGMEGPFSDSGSSLFEHDVIYFM